MKNLISFCGVVAFLFIATLNGYSYSIKVKINGLKDSTCYLGHYFGQKQYTPVDTAKADDQGNLTFAKKKTLKEGVYLIIIPGTYFEVIIGSEQDIKIETDTSNLIANMKTKGSVENEIFYNFQKFMIEKGQEGQKLVDDQKKMKNADSIKANQERLSAIQKSVKDYKDNLYKQYPTTLTAKLLKAAEDPEVPEFKKPDGTADSLRSYLYYKQHYFDNYDFSDERMLRTPIFIPRIDKFMKEMTVQIPDSIIKSADFLIKKAEANKEIFKYCVSNITNTYETSNMMGMDAVFVHMADTYYLKGRCFWIDTAVERKIRERANILRPLLLGKPCPDIYSADTSGNYVPLHTIKGKYVILIFWDADCGHCQKEVPKLFALYNDKLKAKGVVVYAATIERDNKSWTRFLREKKLFAPGWYNVRDQYNHTDFHQTFDVYSTPVIYILDDQKKFIAKRIGVDQIADFLDNYDKRGKK
ncbi:MAG TPA: redoxin domain-containing protein [Cytophagaceae bacterium]|nr:redoxin domain-containing protein [Cytophagaceae bacterium]